MLSRILPSFWPAVFLTALSLIPNSSRSQSPARPDILLADFEGETYGAWKVTGEAFGAGPARGRLPG